MVGKIVSLVEELNSEVACALENEAVGGFFYLIVSELGASEPPPPAAVARIGRMMPEKARGRYEKAKEKALRLFVRKDDSSSWQSRNPDAHQWGGAVRLNSLSGTPKDIILSFSGHPEEWDEAMMLAVAYRMNWGGREDLRNIAHETARQHLQCLFDRTFA